MFRFTENILLDGWLSILFIPILVNLAFYGAARLISAAFSRKGWPKP